MTREDGHIGLLQGVILVYASLTAKLFLQYPAFLIEVGGPAGWQVALVMTVAALLLFLPTAALARRFPGQGLSEICQQVAGPFLGILFTLAICAWLLATVTITIRNFTENFIIAMLPTTPPSILTAVIVVCIVYCSYRGIEPLSRATQILFPVILAGLLVMLFFNLPRSEIGRLYPFWGHGFPETATGGVFYAGMGAEVVALILLGSAFRTPSTLRNSGLVGLLLFGLTTAAVTAVLVMVFGAPDAAQQPFPMFTLARLVYLGRFLQRTESLIVMFWFFAAGVRLAVLFHAAAVGITGSLGLPFYRPLLFPLALLVGSLSLLPEDFLVVLRLDRDWLRPLGGAVFLIPLLLLVLAAVRRKGGFADVA